MWTAHRTRNAEERKRVCRSAACQRAQARAAPAHSATPRSIALAATARPAPPATPRASATHVSLTCRYPLAISHTARSPDNTIYLLLFLQLNVHLMTTVRSTKAVSMATVKTRARSVRRAVETQTAWLLRTSPAAVARLEPRVTRDVHASPLSVTTTRIATIHKFVTD